MKAVVLAAGRGERLKPYTNYLPKPLISLRGRSLVRHVVAALRRAGLDEILIVTGYGNELIDQRVSTWDVGGCIVKPIYNPDWHVGNAASLRAAKRELEREDHFVLSMSDHIYEPSIVERAVASNNGENTVCVDRSPMYLTDLEEATKVALDDHGRVTQIGKGIDRWNAIDTGVFVLRGDIFGMMPRGATQISDCMKALASSMLLYGCDITGRKWLEIDTPEDLDHARSVVDWL